MINNVKSFSDVESEITELVNEGNDILEVNFGAGFTNFFLVEGFEPPIGGSVHTAPYLQFRGCLINDFFSMNVYNHMNRNAFIGAFTEKYVKKLNKQSFKLSDRHLWRLYSK